MIELIKLVDANDQTKSGMQWGVNITNHAVGLGSDLCTDGVIHLYQTPLLAVFLDPLQGDYLRKGGHAYRVVTPEIVANDGMKVGAKQVTTLERVTLPKVTLTQRVAFGILCAQDRCFLPAFRKWAHEWLWVGKRGAQAAEAAAKAALEDDSLFPGCPGGEAAFIANDSAVDAAEAAALLAELLAPTGTEKAIDAWTDSTRTKLNFLFPPVEGETVLVGKWRWFRMGQVEKTAAAAACRAAVAGANIAPMAEEAMKF